MFDLFLNIALQLGERIDRIDVLHSILKVKENDFQNRTISKSFPVAKLDANE